MMMFRPSITILNNMVTIQNDLFKVSATPKGAELTSILSLKNGIEYLWQADPAVWPRHAPVLFPIVGRLEDSVYQVSQKTYELPQHGFARDLPFSLVMKSEDSIVYQLLSDTSTLARYPYKFELRIQYTLLNNTLVTGYEIINRDDKDIYFSVGAHPGFNCPLTSDEKFEDYYLEFDQKETVHKHLLKDGLLSGETALLLSNENKIAVSKDLFKQDALVFKNLKSKKISLKSHTSSHYVAMEFEGFPFFGIWAKPGTDKFVCLEPWNGVTSTKGIDNGFKNKEGVLKLGAGKAFYCEFKLIFG